MLLPLLAGLVFGAVAGLLPGIHPNTIAQILKDIPANPMDLAVAIIAATAANNIIALIPAIFLFIPERETVLSVLPGQRMVQEGLGKYAIWVCGAAAMLTLLFLVVLLPISFHFLPTAYNLIHPFLGPLLILISLLFLFQERKVSEIVKASALFLAAGAFGVFILDSHLLVEPLFPVFTGFFALSNLLLASTDVSLPQQKEWKEETVTKRFIGSIAVVVLFGTILGVAADILPAIGSPAQLATFGSTLVGSNPALFLAMTTSIAVGHSANSIVAFQTIGKTRTGATVHISELITNPSTSTTTTLLIVFFVVTSISVALLFLLSNIFIKWVKKIDLRVVNILLFIYLTAMIGYFGGFFGLVTAAVATAIGMLPPLIGVRRTHLMGFLIIPTILYLVL